MLVEWKIQEMKTDLEARDNVKDIIRNFDKN